jgi:hypothetical protein
MNNYKDLEEANKEVERSKAILHNTENVDNNENPVKAEKEEKEGSGIFTADGKELPKIDGGYDLIEPGGSLGDDEFVSE